MRSRLNYGTRPILLGILVLLGLCRTSASPAAATREWRFKVYLNGNAIGYHDFTVTERNGKRHVQSEARFDVKFLFISAYTYRQTTTETWRDGCLTTLNARTNDNGDKTHVTGQRRDDHFSVSTRHDESDLPACVLPFAYWNPAVLSAPRLLNTQTGKYLDVKTTNLGADSVKIDGHARRATHYRIEAQGVPIELWYSRPSMQWLALKTQIDNGKTLRYKLQPAAGSSGR